MYEINVKNNEKNYEYDIYENKRNGKKYNEEKNYSKHSFNIKDVTRIKYIKIKKEMDRDLNNDIECDNIEEEGKDENGRKKIKKREIKQINEENENYGNNYENIIVKAKKKKKPKKDRVRFQKNKNIEKK